MTAEKFIKYLENPKGFTKNDYQKVTQLIEQYPYFQSAHILLLKYSEAFDKKNKQRLLQKSSVFVTDRSSLFKTLRMSTGVEKKTIQAVRTEKKAVPKFVQKGQKEKLDEQLKQIEAQGQKPVNDNQKTDKTIKKVVAKESEGLSNKGKKAHNALLNDVFKPKVKKNEIEKEKLVVPKKENKAVDISAEKLTEDIYSKIAGLKKEKKQETKNEKVTKIEKSIENISKKIKKEDHKDIKNAENKSLEKKEKVEQENLKKITELKKDKTIEVAPVNKKTDVIIETALQSKQDEGKAKIVLNEEKSVEHEIKPIKEKPIKVKADTHKEETFEIDKDPVIINKISVKKEKEDTGKKEKTAAEKLTERINQLKKDKNKEESPNREKKKETLPIEKKEIINKEENKETKKEETKKVEKKPISSEDKNDSAAESLLEKINRFKSKKTEEKEKLINEFVKTEPRLNRKNDPNIKGNVAEDSSKEKSPVVTELMANIYINQGYYDKAIYVFEKLILKNPEKKNYFATKIKETEELK